MDWYYHDPAQGRVGPLSADDLRLRYRERRVQLDTLVWREGMREWQPLARVVDEVDLADVEPDPGLPPPLPPVISPGAAGMLARPAGMPGPTVRPSRRARGCLVPAIVTIVVLVALAIPVIAILAAIAIPQYQDYTVRAKLAAAIDEPARRVQPALLEARDRLGLCPGSAGEMGLDPDALPPMQAGELDDGRCAFEFTVAGVDPRVDGTTVLYAYDGADGTGWDCSGGDLPDRFRPPACRTSSLDEMP